MSDAEDPDEEEVNPYNHPNYIECPEEYEDLWNEYSEWLLDAYEKQTTIDRRKKTSRYWLAWCSENDVDPLTDDERDLKMYVYDHLDQSDQSISARVTGVSMFHKWAYDNKKIDYQELIGYSVEENIKGVDPTRTQKSYNEGKDGENYHYATKEDVEKMVESVPEPETRNVLILKCLWQTGMRSVELSNTRWSNVNLDEKFIKIESAKKDPDDDNYRRKAYFQDDLVYWLRRWWERERDALSPYADDSDYLLLTHQKPSMRSEHISRIVKEAAHNAGIQTKIGNDAKGEDRWKYTAHALRHGHAHHVCNYTDTPLQLVARQLGHKVDTLVETYVQDDDEAHRDWYQDRDGGASDVL